MTTVVEDRSGFLPKAAETPFCATPARVALPGATQTRNLLPPAFLGFLRGFLGSSFSWCLTGSTCPLFNQIIVLPNHHILPRMALMYYYWRMIV